MVVTVPGLAELVEEEDDRLQSQHQHDAADEAGGVKGGVLMRGRGGRHWGARRGTAWRSRRERKTHPLLRWMKNTSTINRLVEFYAVKRILALP